MIRAAAEVCRDPKGSAEAHSGGLVIDDRPA